MLDPFVMRLRVLALGFGLVTAACGGSDAPATSSSSQATTCNQDGRKDTYVAGLSKIGGTVQVAVMDALPAPPEKGKNALTLEVKDAEGKPLDDAQIAIVPFMPDHGHGSAVTPKVTPAGGGRYDVTDVVLTMPGLWEVRVDVQSPSASGAVTFAFCVEG